MGNILQNINGFRCLLKTSAKCTAHPQQEYPHRSVKGAYFLVGKSPFLTAAAYLNKLG